MFTLTHATPKIRRADSEHDKSAAAANPANEEANQGAATTMTFVPAWKRLGLQLKKTAQTEATTPPAHVEQHTDNRNGSSTTPHNDAATREESKPAKRRKLANGRAADRHAAAAAGDAGDAGENATGSTSTSSSRTVKSEKRSSKSSTSKPAAKAKKSAPSSKHPTTSPTPTPVQPKPSVLAYLTTFHTAPTEWKFNKSKQTQLLKHAFNPDVIPSAHNDALVAYLSGLKGQAARERVRTAAKSILAQPPADDNTTANNPTDEQPPSATDDNHHHSDPNQMDTAPARETARKAALDHQLKIQRDALDERMTRHEQRKYAKTFPQLLEKRRRAEMILEKLREYDDFYGLNHLREVDAAPDEESGNGERTGKRKRGTRGSRGSKVRPPHLRTGVPDDDELSSSSSESESESESEMEGNDGGNVDGDGDDNGDEDAEEGDDGEDDSEDSEASSSSNASGDD